jgi:hypothetical protein
MSAVQAVTCAGRTRNSVLQIGGWSLVGLVLAAIGVTALRDAAPGSFSAGAALEASAGAPATAATGETTARDAYAKLPLAFVPNKGQADARVRYSAHAGGVSVYFTQKAAIFAFAKGKKGSVLRLSFLGANPTPTIEGRQSGTGRVNYLLGNDPATWHTNLPTYGQVVYRDLWPGVDMAFRGAAGKLKYEFVVQPGARVADIRLAYRGARTLSVSHAGVLAIGTPLGVLRDERPRSYQFRQGKRVPVALRYVLQGGTSYGFSVAGGYDPARQLVVDPGLVYSTFLGGTTDDRSFGIAVDASGSAYVTGDTFSPDFPTTPSAFDQTFNGVADTFVTKLNPAGSALVYSTFVGGSAFDSGLGIAVDAGGNAYVGGQTFSPDYPTTPGAFDPTFNFGGDDGVVTKINAAGSALVYSTFLGGSSRDNGFEIAVDPSGNAYTSGNTSSVDYPTTPGAFDQTFNGGQYDAFAAKLNPAGSALVYSTFLGGSSRDDGRGIAVDLSGRAHVGGETSSADYPTTVSAFDPTFNGATDAFVTKLNAAGSALIYSTFLGGSSLDGGAPNAISPKIAVDPDSRAYVTGGTSSVDYPTTPGAFQPVIAGGFDAFVTKLSSTGSSLVYSTYLGGTLEDAGLAIAVDRTRKAHISGFTESPNFPTTPGAFDPTHNGAADVLVTKLNGSGSALEYSTFLGGTSEDGRHPFFGFGAGIAVDTEGAIYVSGDTLSPDFPTTPGAFDPIYNGATDAFVTKLEPAACPDDDDDLDDDGLDDEREGLFGTFFGDSDSDDDGVPDGNEDSDDDGEDDEDEDDDTDECPDDDDGDGEDDEDEDDEEDD